MAQGTVLTTEQAQTLINSMKTQIGEFEGTINHLIQTGNQLAEPSVWQGQLATQFEGEWNGQVAPALQRALQDLTQLNASCLQVHQNISHAGGNA